MQGLGLSRLDSLEEVGVQGLDGSHQSFPRSLAYLGTPGGDVVEVGNDVAGFLRSNVHEGNASQFLVHPGLLFQHPVSGRELFGKPLFPKVIESRQPHCDAQQGKADDDGEEHDAFAPQYDGPLCLLVAMVAERIPRPLRLLEGTLGNDGVVRLVQMLSP